MSFAYKSKRQRTNQEEVDKCSQEQGFLTWNKVDSSGLKKIVGSLACQMIWSWDGIYLAVGTVKGLILMINFSQEIHGLQVMVVKDVKSLPRCLRWYQNECLDCAAHNGVSFKFNLLTKSMSDEHMHIKNDYYTCTFWKDKILCGCKHIQLIEGNKIIKTFGPGENFTSCMIVVENVLFVAYDYSQNSSSDKSIIAFSLPSCAPVSNQLTDSLFSYSHLCYSLPYIYGLTSKGDITRFHSRHPYRPDKHFLIKINTPIGFKVQFDIKQDLLVYGDNSGKLILKKFANSKGGKNGQSDSLILEHTVLKDFGDSSDPVINVKFHPTLNFVVFSRWHGDFGVVSYSAKFKL